MPENKTEEVQSLGAKMDQYTQKKKAEWNFNPFKKPETDKYFSSWADPYAYNSSILSSIDVWSTVTLLACTFA